MNDLMQETRLDPMTPTQISCWTVLRVSPTSWSLKRRKQDAKTQRFYDGLNCQMSRPDTKLPHGCDNFLACVSDSLKCIEITTRSGERLEPYKGFSQMCRLSEEIRSGGRTQFLCVGIGRLDVSCQFENGRPFMFLVSLINSRPKKLGMSLPLQKRNHYDGL